MKTLFRTQTKWLLVLTAILAPTLLISVYSARAKARRTNADQTSGVTGLSVTEQVPDRTDRPEVDRDDDPEFVKARREYLDWYFGVSGKSVPPADYATTMAAIRALPTSPLVQGENFVSSRSFQITVASPTPWAAPIPPPIVAPSPWNNDPSSVRIDAFALHPTNPNIVYAGGYGGLARATDGGITWQFLSDNWNSQSVTSISIDPNSPNHVYVGTGSDYALYGAGVYRTTDTGTTWTHLGATEFGATVIRTIAVDPHPLSTAATVYVAVDRSSSSSGLWRSTDAGATWSRLLSGSYNGVWALAIDGSTNPSTIYIADSNGVSKSTDGTNWNVVYPSNPNWNGALRLSVVNAVPYLLEPNTDPWPTYKLYKRENPNNPWTEIPTNNLSPGVFAVDRTNRNIILIGTDQFWRTTDEGLNWANVRPQSDNRDIHADQRAIAFSPVLSGLVYSGTDGGIWKSSTHGEADSWDNLNQTLPGALLYNVAISQDGSLISGTQDNGTIISDAGGVWKIVLGGDSNRNLIDPLDSNIAYYTSYWSDWFQRYNKSTGQTVDIRPTQFNGEPCNFFPAFSMNRSSPTNIIAGCQHLVRSTNQGTDWTTIGGSLADPTLPNEWWNTVNTSCEAPSDPSVIYASATGGRVLVTADANLGPDAHWTVITADLGEVGGIYNIAVHPTNSQIAYLACAKGIYKTTAGPFTTSWTNLNAPIGPPPDFAYFGYHDLLIDPDEPSHIIVGCQMGVFSTMNDGSTWENMGAGIPAGMLVSGLSFDRVHRRLAASTYGRGAYVINLPPVVSITSPANGALVHNSVAISANGSQNVVGILFQIDGTDFQDDSQFPYSVDWSTTTATNGSHTLTAVARDAVGRTTISTGVTVTVDNAVPTVSMTAPANGASIRGTTVTVSATASDNVGVIGVQFQLDGAILGTEDISSPYSITWNTTTATNGSHTLTAVARDAAGNTTTSTGVGVTVDNAAPAVSMTAPAGGASVSGTAVTVSATASDNVGVVGVQFKLDGAILGTEDTSFPYSITWNSTTASNGSHTLTAVARDAAGNTMTSTGVTVTVDNTLPTVSMTAPANGATVSGTAVTVSATASDNVGVVGVQFKLDGAILGTEDTSSPYSITWNSTTASGGTHTLTAVARDAAGNTKTSSGVTVTVDNASPTVSVTAPASGASVAGTAVTVSATASDDVGVVGVQFKLDGANLGTEDTSAPYSKTWNSTTASNGNHTLTAVARDASGKSTTSAGVTVIVDNTLPTVSMTAPASGASISGTSVTVSATASDNVGVVGVQFKLDGAILGTEDTSSPYSITWNSTTASNGNHTLTAVARDAAGNTKTSSNVTVTVDNTLPTVSITAPTNGASVSGTVTISATASDNVGVIGVQFKVDGANVGTEDTSSPYSRTWNASAQPGSRTLTAVARDAAGNTKTSAPITVTAH